MTRELPNTRAWQPRESATETLSSALQRECLHAEMRLQNVLLQEAEFAVDSFDSGQPFEAATREQISRLLPRRYGVTSGRVVDSGGRTAGQADIVVFNDLWFPEIRPSESTGSSFLPIEGAYAIGEVKQTLSAETLDKAMEKLVACSRLDRPQTHAHRVVENRDGSACPHGLTNPLFTFVLGGRLDKGTTFESLIERFYDILTTGCKLDRSTGLDWTLS